MWGLLFEAVDRHFPRGAGYWGVALLFGALGPTLAAWFIVFPLKGLPLGGGWRPARLVTGLLVNGAWGWGTALFLRWGTRWWGSHAE